jgi:hypothetical protein
MVTDFSEPERRFEPVGGYRSDNLTSNERSIQEVLPELRQRRRTGAFIGVGPEQNFTYVLALEPAIAFVVDIRRDNLLLHLLYKALAEASEDRAGFLSRLFGRIRPSGVSGDISVELLFAALARSPRSPTLARDTMRDVVAQLTRVHGFSLSAGDVSAMSALYDKFVTEGPLMRWDAGGSWIPTYAELMAAQDPAGVRGSYLASEEAFQTFRRYQLRNRIVPVVGDFAGGTALRAIGRHLASQGLTVSAFYTSNVEVYLGAGVPRFEANVAALPIDDRSVFVRTRFQMTGETNGRPDFRTSTYTVPVRDYLSPR